METPGRKAVLDILEHAHRPIGAYEMIDLLAGPAGETLYLTEVRAPVPPFDLPMNARFTAERLFIPVLSAPDREAAARALTVLFSSPECP